MHPPTAGGSPDVFVSYASPDRDRVLAITARLEAAGVAAWVDLDRIDGGMRWADQIVRGIRGAKVLALMCSDAAMRSRAVQQEIQLAWKYGLRYLPVLLERVRYPEQLEFFLEGCQWVEAIDLPGGRWLTPLLRALAHTGVACPAAGDPSVGDPPVLATQPRPSLDGLRAVARFTDRIWPLVVEGRATHAGGVSYAVRDLGAARDGVEHRVRLGSRLFWAVRWDQAAHLLLLDEGPEGKVYCLCPSWFAPDTRVRPGVNLLPPESAGCEPFVLTGVPGREHLLAILTDAPLDLGWMPPDPAVPARVLDRVDIERLTDLLRSLPPDGWVAAATYCDVVV